MTGKDKSPAAVALALGERIRRLRSSNGLTLSALAGRTALSEAFLSRLERGLASASIASLVQIAEALGISMQELFEDHTRPSRTRLSVHRSADKDGSLDVVKATGYRWRRLAGGAPRDRMDVFHLIFPRRARMKTMVSHPGQEHCFVLSGEIAFFVGDERHVLAAGDGIFIASDQPHRAENLSRAEAHVLMTVARPEHEHLSLDWWQLGAPVEVSSVKHEPQHNRSKKEEAT